jgi:cobalt-zinc-cadmium efflux system protein
LKPHNNESTEKSFILSLSLTAVIFIVELIGGIWTGSLALISDSAHVFLDVFALGISFIAMRYAAKPPDTRHTYGFHRFEVLAALINGVTLVVIALFIFYESYKRFINPGEIKSGYMLIIAIIGLVVNLLVAFILRKENHAGHDHGPQDINIHSAYLHVIGDTLSSVGVIVAAIVISFTNWLWLDPVISIIIGFIILSGAYRVSRNALHILLEGTPDNLEVSSVQSSLESFLNVDEIHDLHIWNICSGHVALSAHVVTSVDTIVQRETMLMGIKKLLIDKYQIEHVTLQIEQEKCFQMDCT